MDKAYVRYKFKDKGKTKAEMKIDAIIEEERTRILE